MGGGYTYTTTLTAFLTVAMLTAMAAAQGSGTVGTCAAQLTGCISYLNATTTPPESCCGPLKDAVTNQKACLCGLYDNPALMKGINITQALNLPVICKIHSDSSPADFCKGVTPSKSPSSSNSTSTPSGGSSSGTGSGSGSNSAATITGTVFISSLFMFVTYVVVY
ncbi:hypothetical protein RND81_13G046400 [Saponaria officinalis]|uniref:Bifunctional inhibitor/plant lipid transfer protein/seed storage helical domain-containing protein n=1 Tax=Saponaria officinalis TaxID=3572 RepID=A0AAW1GYL9_SAPOF